MRVKTCLLLILQVDEGSTTPTPEAEVTLPFPELRDEEEEEKFVSLQMIGVGEPSLLEILLQPWRTSLGSPSGGPTNKHNLSRGCRGGES